VRCDPSIDRRFRDGREVIRLQIWGAYDSESISSCMSKAFSEICSSSKHGDCSKAARIFRCVSSFTPNG